MEGRPTAGLWMEAGREAALVLSAQRGDFPALFELLRWYQRPLWRLCFAFTHEVREAEQLAQVTALRAMRNIRQQQVGQPFYPWLVRLARTLAISAARRRAGDAPELGNRRPNGEPWATGARDWVFEKRVLAAFTQLATDEQLLLALRLCERLTYTDVAATSGLALTATMHRIAAVRERLEQEIERQERAA